MEKVGQKRGRLVLVPCPFQGHINPILQLGNFLHHRGFSITIAHTQFNFPNPSSHPDFTFLQLPDGLSDYDVIPLHSMTLITCLNNTNCKATLHESLAKMMEQQQQTICIIYDAVMYFTEEVASHMKLPSIMLHVSSAANALIYTVFPHLLKQGCTLSQDSTSQDLVPGLHPLRIKDLHISFYKNLLQLIERVHYIRSSSAIILNTVDCLEGSSLAQLKQQYEIPLFSIGPLYKAAPTSTSSLLHEDTSCITWLDEQTNNSVIYVSLGSIASLDEKELGEMAWGLANSQQPFLWVIRPGSIHGTECIELLPEGFKETVGERGCIVKWAPQKEVLAHKAVGGFWSHCGWNSTLESICEGVPMICQPHFGDQKEHARYLSYVWKIGLAWENDLERAEIERIIRKLMVEKEGEEMRQRSMELKEKIELCMRKGGSSYNSLNELVEYILSF